MKTLTTLLIAFVLSGSVTAQSVNDTTAIKLLLEKESATWRQGDVKRQAACWQIRPYSKVWVSTIDGKFIDVPVETIVHPKQDRMGGGGSSENFNYVYSIRGDGAWVSHDERSIAKDGSVTYSHEVRMLEKIAREWKLVAQFIYAYRPE